LDAVTLVTNNSPADVDVQCRELDIDFAFFIFQILDYNFVFINKNIGSINKFKSELKLYLQQNWTLE